MGNEKFIYIVAFTDLFASNLVLPVMNPYLGRLGASNTTIGILVAGHVILQMVGNYILSKWVDNKSRSSAMQMSLLACCASYFVMGSATTVPVVFACRLIQGAFQHMQMVSISLLGQSDKQEPQRRLQKWLGTYGVYIVSVAIVLACHMIEVQGGYKYTCFFIATVCLTNFSLVYIFAPSGSSDKKISSKKKGDASKKVIPSKPETINIKQTMSTIYKAFKGIKGPMADLLTLKFILEFALFSQICNFAPVLWQEYRTPPRWIGYTLGLLILGSVLAVPVAARISKLKLKDQPTMALYGFAVYTAMYACLFLAPSWIWIIVSLVPLLISNALLTSTVSDLEKQRKESAAASGEAVIASAKVTAPVITGFAYDVYGFFGASLLRVLVSGAGIIVAMSLSKKPTQGKNGKNAKNVKKNK